MIQAWRDIFALPRSIWFLTLGMIVNRMGTMALPYFSLILIKRMGLSADQASIAMAAYGLTALAAAILGGWLSDRVDPKRIVVWFYFATGAVLLAFPYIPGFWGMILFTLVWAFVAEIGRPPIFTLVSKATPPHQQKQAFALTRLGVNLGMSIGPALGGFLLDIDYRLIFWIDGITSILGGIVIARTVAGVAPSGETRPAFLKSFDPWRDPLFRVFFLGLFLTALVYFQHTATEGLFLNDTLGLSPSTFGMIFSINTLMIIFLEVPLNSWTASWDLRRSIGLGALLGAIGFGMLAFVTTVSGVIVSTVIWTVGEMMCFPASNAMISRLAPPSKLGVYMGWYMFCFGLAQFVAGPAGVKLFFEMPQVWFWSALGGIGLISTWILWTLKLDKPTPRPQPTHL